MSQHDYDIANQTAPAFRSDLNDALGAIATNNSGATEPSVTYANQWWYDTSNDIIKVRSEADDAWINVGYLDQSTNEFKPYVGGTRVDTQSTATWEAGTSTTEGIVSPAKVKDAIDANSQAIWEYSSILSTTSGTSFDFTGLPSGINAIEVWFDRVSLNGNDDFLVQLGTSGGLVTSGYTSASSSSAGDTGASTSGALIYGDDNPRLMTGVMYWVRKPGGNSWIESHTLSENSNNRAVSGSGRVTLGGELTQLRLTRNGSSSFDNGDVYVRYHR